MSREQLIGTWKLVALEVETSDGEISYPWGEDVVGIHTWDETGHFAIQSGKAERERFASDIPFEATPEEASTAIKTYLAYFGTFEVDEIERTVTHNGIGSLFPNWVGVPEIRSYEFSEDQLILASESTVGGNTLTVRRVWERLVA